MASIPTSRAQSTQVLPASRITDFDVSLFQAGKHYRLYQKFGCQLDTLENQRGAYFSVWAPYAEQVSVIGSFNNWQPHIHPLYPRWDQSGIWEGFIPGVKAGDLYKFFIRSRDGEVLYKGDP